MNKITSAACIMAVCILSACSNNEPDQDPGLKGADSTSAVALPVSGTAPVSSMDTSIKMLNQTGATVNPLPANIAAQAVANTAPGMNPAHGQPNHRCDIAVGAPLNSPVSKTAAPAVQTSTATTTPAATAAKTVTAPGMNPPHGEPNHRCDISVGAPLNSPATKPAAQTVTPMAVPAKKDSLR